MTTSEQAPPDAGPGPEVLAGVERFMGDVRGWLAFWLLMLGHRTGLLAAVRAGGGSAEEVAARAGTALRPTEEWLAGMTAAGYLSHYGGVFAMADGQAATFDGGVLPFDPTVLFTFPDVLTRVQPAIDRSVRDGQRGAVRELPAGVQRGAGRDERAAVRRCSSCRSGCRPSTGCRRGSRRARTWPTSGAGAGTRCACWRRRSRRRASPATTSTRPRSTSVSPAPPSGG